MAALRDRASALVDSGALSGRGGAGEARGLIAKIDAAEASLARGMPRPACHQLGALSHQLDALVRSTLDAADAGPLRRDVEAARARVCCGF